jgi:hypothetical protein
MKSKKGDIEVQFNWIFVLIIGAIILVFFFGFIQKQRGLSEQKISYTLLSDIESIATGAGVTKGTAQSVDMPKRGIFFDCTDECLCTFSSGEVNKPFEDKIMFTPTEISGSELIMWTKEWKFPFRITNFVYATSPAVMYFLVYSDSSADSVNLATTMDSLLPGKIDRKKVEINSLSQVKNENYIEVRFVFLAIDAEVVQLDVSFKEAKVTALAIYPDTGQLIFYDKLVKNKMVFEAKNSFYFGDASMFGALFAGNAKLYECNMKSAFARMKYVSRIYKERTDLLQAAAQQGVEIQPSCAIYSSMDIEDLIASANANLQQIQSVTVMATAYQNLENLNEQLLRASCPRVY